MTFATFETSNQDAVPIELYEFVVGVRRFYYTSAARDIVVAARTWESLQISRSELEDSGDIPKNQLQITSSRDIGVSELFRVAPPSDVVVLNVYRFHLDDPDADIKLFWTGRVLSCEWTGGSGCRFVCESLYTALKRRGLRRLYQRSCPHVLYGAKCTLANTSFRDTILLDGAVSGNLILDGDFGARPDGYYSGGYLEVELPSGVVERRGVKQHIGTEITITHPIVGLVPGMTIQMFAGCDHTLSTCASKFSNTANYGGFPFVPSKNPFNGSNPF